MKTRSLSIRILRMLGIVVVLFIVVVLTINFSIFDEELRPEVVNIMHPSKMPENEKNAYFAIMGLGGAADRDMIEVGVNLVERFRKNQANDVISPLSESDYHEIEGGIDLDSGWDDINVNCSGRRNISCSTEIPQDLDLNDKRLLLMLKRHEKILQTKRFQTVGDWTNVSPMLKLSKVIILSKLSNILAFNSTEPMVFIQQLKLDINFWRRTLDDKNTLLDKMVAVAAIWNDLRFLSQYLLNRETTKEELELIKIILTPLNSEELNIMEAFRFEALGRSNYWEQLSDPKGDWLSIIGLLFLQNNATINADYEYNIEPTECFSSLSSVELYKEIKALKTSNGDKCVIPTKPFSGGFPEGLYNPVGKMIMSDYSVARAYVDYVARVHDLNGMLSLVKLQLNIKNIIENSIEEAIKNSAIKNPYTGMPMDYDKENSLLSFECQDSSSSCKIAL